MAPPGQGTEDNNIEELFAWPHSLINNSEKSKNVNADQISSEYLGLRKIIELLSWILL